MTESDAPAPVSPVLRAEGIVAGYDGPPILNDVEVSVNPAEITVILGPNGAGKSTLAKVIIGLISANEGKVFLEGENVLGLGPHQLVRKGLAYLPQVANIFDEMTVLENLEMGGFTYRGDLQRRISPPAPRIQRACALGRRRARGVSHAAPKAQTRERPRRIAATGAAGVGQGERAARRRAAPGRSGRLRVGDRGSHPDRP
ncbi:MAG: ATP-binding cassette domain-containing protein, partial [Actinomycetota bacterium]|nr:ATP-binding cassette domain-containing protein [Actinomycetota bacterium]